MGTTNSKIPGQSLWLTNKKYRSAVRTNWLHSFLEVHNCVAPFTSPGKLHKFGFLTFYNKVYCLVSTTLQRWRCSQLNRHKSKVVPTNTIRWSWWYRSDGHAGTDRNLSDGHADTDRNLSDGHGGTDRNLSDGHGDTDTSLSNSDSIEWSSCFPTDGRG